MTIAADSRRERRIIEISRLFDADWYRASYPDVTEDALDHYVTRGWQSGFSPSPDFDGPWYLANNPDVANAGINPLVHYLRYGATEGRVKRAFDPQERVRMLWPIIRSDAEELKDVANPISPTSRLLSLWEAGVVTAPRIQTGTVVQKILARLPETVDHLVLVPWLGISGGSEKVTERLLAFLRTRYESGRLAVLAPDAIFDLRPARRLMYEVPIVALNDVGLELSAANRAEIVDYILLNLRPRTIHVINSDAGWNALRQRAKDYAKDSRVFVNIYSDIRLLDGAPAGYFWRYLPELVPHLAGVFADNCAAVERAIQNFSLLPEQRALFTVVPTPIVGLDGGDPASQCRPYMPVSQEHSMWMSRIAHEKRIDVLREIALRMPERRFSMYGEILPGAVPHDFLAWTKDIPNVDHVGRFGALEGLPLDEFDSYVFTTSAEGMPLAILEAAMLGLAIVAPDVGGISEFIDNATGWLVPHPDAIDEYVASLDEIAASPDEAARRVKRAQQRLVERHSWSNFQRVLSAVPGYIVGGEAND